VRSQLFQAFHPGRSGGMGLGLYISCNIVRQHGGSLALDSREGHGTTFTVRLPR
jgi:signal transduction histidine kinase